MRTILFAAVLLSASVASAGDFFFVTPRGFTYGQSNPGYTWTTGPRGYNFFYTPQTQRYPTNYFGGFGNTYNVQQNYGQIYAPQYYRVR